MVQVDILHLTGVAFGDSQGLQPAPHVAHFNQDPGVDLLLPLSICRGILHEPASLQ